MKLHSWATLDVSVDTVNRAKALTHAVAIRLTCRIRGILLPHRGMFAAALCVGAPTVTGVSMSTESTGLIGDPSRDDATPFADVSPSLYNPELAPTKREGRRW